ncbi:MAG: bifunctional homocysteine S-methyltransferase/methylenetetrahydrofolate reductase [Roseburia sp.]|nr:bifunctional homocysteine S-methyltransferase/methylenetetrahydrofolate reductase [Roseburia sp.]
MKLRDYLKKKRLVTDGAFGTYFESRFPEEESVAELCNLTAPGKVKDTHRSYIDSGAKLIRTNTFAANTMFLEEISQVEEVVKRGYEIACEAAAKSGREVFVGADIGPIYDTGFLGREVILEEYKKICDVFLSCGADIFVLETQSEFTYVKEITEYIKSRGDVFVLVQFSVDKSGYTRSGISLQGIIERAAAMDTIDAYGFNCGVGAAHLYRLLKQASFPNDKYVTALPNAGYPVTLRGKTVYADSRDYFVETMGQVADLGVEILGGCCGTTPEYIQKLSERLKNLPGRKKKILSGGKKISVKDSSAFLKKLSEKEKPVIVELDPPFHVDFTKVMQGAEILKSVGVDLISLADSPMARARADAGKLAAKIQNELDVAVMPHIACRDRNLIAMRSGILGDYMNGLRHFLIVTGDPVEKDLKGRVTPVFDFNSITFMEYLSHMNEEVFGEEPVIYGGALNYHGANVDAIVRRMEQKAEMGCSMFLTQPVYSREDVERLSYIKDHTHTRIMCGILPLVNYRNAMFMANEMPGIRVPKEVIERYRPDMTREEGEETGIACALSIAESLRDIADGYYFITPFNRASMIARIIRQLKG